MRRLPVPADESTQLPPVNAQAILDLSRLKHIERLRELTRIDRFHWVVKPQCLRAVSCARVKEHPIRQQSEMGTNPQRRVVYRERTYPWDFTYGCGNSVMQLLEALAPLKILHGSEEG